MPTSRERLKKSVNKQKKEQERLKEKLGKRKKEEEKPSQSD